jgi:hypothetical protein
MSEDFEFIAKKLRSRNYYDTFSIGDKHNKLLFHFGTDSYMTIGLNDHNILDGGVSHTIEKLKLLYYTSPEFFDLLKFTIEEEELLKL